MSSFTVTRLDEIPEVTDGREPWRPIRHHLGITAFGVNAWTGAAAGDRILNEHDESDEGDAQEELYLVLSGHAAFEVDGERLDAPAGTLVYVRPRVKRTAFAEEADTTVLAIGGTPGKAYEPTGWEVWAPIGQLYQAGDYAKAADVGREALEEHPRVSGAVLQRRVLREPRRPNRRRGRTSPARVRGVRARPRARPERLRLRPDPRRPRLRRARGQRLADHGHHRSSDRASRTGNRPAGACPLRLCRESAGESRRANVHGADT